MTVLVRLWYVRDHQRGEKDDETQQTGGGGARQVHPFAAGNNKGNINYIVQAFPFTRHGGI